MMRIVEMLKMGEKNETKNNRKMLGIIFAVIGIILVFTGIVIATVHSHLRGSGLGTVSIVLGAVLLIVGFLRLNVKSA